MDLIITRADTIDGFIYLSLDGVLSQATAPLVRQLLNKCLVACPIAVIIDVSGLHAMEKRLLTVFPAAAAQQEGFGVAVVLAGASPQLRTLMRGRVLGAIPSYDSIEQAHAAAVSGRGLLRCAIHLEPVDTAAAQARAMVTAACERWGLAYPLDSIRIIVSELVSNVVRHAGSSMTVTIALSGAHVFLAVTDHSALLPVLSEPDSSSAATTIGGRGMHLVEALSTAWGVTRIPRGKRVWASVRVVPVQHAPGRDRAHDD